MRTEIENNLGMTFQTGRPLVLGIALLFGTLAPAGLVAAADLELGKKIYQTQCADCHGIKGEGVQDVYASPLIGDKSVRDLAHVINKTMPEGSPEDCKGPEAEAVAAYVYETFYSPVAQARNRPVRVEFSRLTVRQYENTVADLIASFLGSRSVTDGQRGLQRTYSDDRKKKGPLDPVIHFAFGEQTPDPTGNKEADSYNVRWDGAIFAPETGDYEFVIESGNTVKLWVNTNNWWIDEPVVNGSVRSTNQTEMDGTIRLLGGRWYPLQLKINKKKNDKHAYLTLKWKPPHGVLEVVPNQFLSPGDAATTYITQTQFPPDDRSDGYERGNTVSQAWDQATTQGAIELAHFIGQKLTRFVNAKYEDPKFRGRAREFCKTFVERAFRRPLTPEEVELYVDRQFKANTDTETAVKRVVLLTMKSPRFLYREVGTQNFDAYATASFLSYGLWDSMPDAELLKAARENRLTTRDQIAKQSERMLSDVRARSKVRQFLHSWLGLERMHGLEKNNELYPDFNRDLVSDLRRSLDLSLEDAIWNGNADFRDLFKANKTYMNARLARFYEVENFFPEGSTKPAASEADKKEESKKDIAKADPMKDQKPDPKKDVAKADPMKDQKVDPKKDVAKKDDKKKDPKKKPEPQELPVPDWYAVSAETLNAQYGQFRPVEFNADKRAGVLTHPYMMAGLSYYDTTSPIHRGVFLSRGVLGRMLKAPPVAVAPAPPDANPHWTTRQRVESQTSADMCQSCHVMINHLGFALEQFDTVGKLRKEEKGKAINDKGKYTDSNGATVEFTGAKALGDYVAASQEAHQAFVAQLFRFTIKQPVQAFGPQELPELCDSFASHEFNIRRLLVEIMTTSTMKLKEIDNAKPPVAKTEGTPPKAG